MKDVMLGLLSSRKFALTVLATVVMGCFVLLGKMPASQFFGSLEHLTAILVASIGIEGAAEKWNSPPPGTINVPLNPPANQ